MRKLLFLLLLAALSQEGMAKGNSDMEKGDYFFRHSAYNNAITYYEKIVNKAPRRKDAVLHAHLGDCYRLVKNPEQAAVWYAKAITAPRKVTKEMKFHYGEVLMTLQRYDEAAEMLKQYSAATPGDRRAANMIRGCEMARRMMAGTPEGVTKFLSINTDRSEIGPALCDKGLAFTSDSMIIGPSKKDKWTGQNYYNMYKVTANVKGDCGSDYEQISGKVNTKYHDGTCVFTKDGAQMYFTRTSIVSDVFGLETVSDDKGTVHLEIMIADDYDAAEKRYKKIRPFVYNDKNYSTTHPALSPDGSMMVFASDMPGGEGAVDLYMCRRGSKGEWEKPVSLGKGINTEGEEMFPVFLDNSTLSFASSGQPGLGGLDVFYTSWNGNGWSSPVNAGIPVNSSWDDMSLVMYPDGVNGYFASNRPAVRKSDNIYHFTKQKLYVQLKIRDSASGRMMEGVTVSVKSPTGVRTLSTDESGDAGSILVPQVDYTLTVSKKGYADRTFPLPTGDLTRASDTLYAAIGMTPEVNIMYKAMIMDEATGQPVPDPMLVITRDGSSKSDTVNLETGALLMRSFDAGVTYRINAVKDKYYSDEKVISTKGYDPEKGVLLISDTLMMCKLGVGAVCQIENILYDFDKAEIRADAITSLDKVIKLLHENPTMKLRINSHTDCKGTDEYNKHLSMERANGVIRYLASKGVKAARLKAEGYGATAPVVKCDKCEECSEADRQKNRRTEFSVLAL